MQAAEEEEEADGNSGKGERLEHVGAAADAAVQVHRDAPLRGLHDLLERADGGRHVVQLARAVVGHDDPRRAVRHRKPRCDAMQCNDIILAHSMHRSSCTSVSHTAACVCFHPSTV